jgi:hypothetical protein
MRPLDSSWCDFYPSIVAQSDVNRLPTYMPNQQMVPDRRPPLHSSSVSEGAGCVRSSELLGGDRLAREVVCRVFAKQKPDREGGLGSRFRRKLKPLLTRGLLLGPTLVTCLAIDTFRAKARRPVQPGVTPNPFSASAHLSCRRDASHGSVGA